MKIEDTFIKEPNLNEALLVSFSLLKEVWESGDYNNIEQFIEAVEINGQIMDIQITVDQENVFYCQAVECFSDAHGYHCRGDVWHSLWEFDEDEIQRRFQNEIA